MNRSESIQNLAAALSAFQGEVQNPKNTAENPYFKSKYAPLGDVLNIVRPLLAKYGLSVIQIPSTENDNISVRTLLIHKSGEWIESEPLTLKMDKPTAQGAGAAITYARRYAISAILGISSEDDDDANSISPQTISREQAAHLFKIADEEIVKEVLTTLGYQKTLEIPADKYDDVIKAVKRVQKEKSASDNNTNKQNTNEKTISEAQIKRLYTLSQGHDDIVKSILQKFNYTSAKEVKRADYDKICELVQEEVKKLDNIKRE